MERASPGPGPVRVYTARNMTAANLAVAFLGGQGIPASVEDEAFHLAQGVGVAMSPLNGIGVLVASDRAREAAQAIEAFDGEAAVRRDEEE